MAATMHFTETNGASAGTETDIGAGTANAGVIRFRAADAYAADSTSPLVKTGAAVYSFKKSLRFKPDTGSTYTTIDTLKFYMATPPTNTEFYVNPSPPASYTQATTAATSATDATWTAHPASASPIAVTGSPSSNATVAFGNFIEVYMRIQDAIATGTTTACTFTFQWNEI